ncbi:DUF2249 domain-containing protein [Thermobacillus composti]|uniref:DUF2249 domain-containing protein n=1 Tax=Thermobacillus composti TaxID=377615 RepID=UPI00030882BC|nr:DUF2249 domain-containing protein [Thermobacillus composti]
MGQFAATVNATEYPPHLKHRVIFETFGKLAPSEAMLLINNHDPVPLRFQFEAMYPGQKLTEMANVEIVDDRTIRIKASLEDAFFHVAVRQDGGVVRRSEEAGIRMILRAGGGSGWTTRTPKSSSLTSYRCWRRSWNRSN